MLALPRRFSLLMSQEHGHALQAARKGAAGLPSVHAASIASPLPIDAIRRHIRVNLTGTIRVSHMASIAGLDALRFARALRREFQITPYALVIATRIEVAEQLLRSGMPVAEVAASAGFCDQSHLTRHFRRWLGTTPSKVRRANGAGI